VSASAETVTAAAPGQAAPRDVAPPTHALSVAEHSPRSAYVGVLLGMVAAICYTGTNIALRGVTREGELDWGVWVTCMKSLPSALSAWCIVGYLALRGRPALPSIRTIGILVTIGLVVQAGGNVFFQWSLAMCGLALTVPTVFATLILTGALLGRTWLGEAVTVRSAIAMGLLIGAIALLGLGAEGAATALPPGPQAIPPTLWVLAGVALAAASGVFYGALGVVIRRTTRDEIPLPATLALISTMGVLSLGIPSFLWLGTTGLAASPQEWSLMIVAGVLNAAAFFAIGGSLRRIPVVQVNLLNASQAALCAMGGVLIYREPLTAALVGGTALTLAGLALMDRRPPVPGGE
jgi:DME family drug/metabolite transporter